MWIRCHWRIEGTSTGIVSGYHGTDFIADRIAMVNRELLLCAAVFEHQREALIVFLAKADKFAVDASKTHHIDLRNRAVKVAEAGNQKLFDLL